MRGSVKTADFTKGMLSSQVAEAVKYKPPMEELASQSDLDVDAVN